MSGTSGKRTQKYNNEKLFLGGLLGNWNLGGSLLGCSLFGTGALRSLLGGGTLGRFLGGRLQGSWTLDSLLLCRLLHTLLLGNFLIFTLGNFLLRFLGRRLSGRLFTCISILGWRFLGNFLLGLFLGVAFLVDSLPASAFLAGAFLGTFFLAFSPSAAVLAILYEPAPLPSFLANTSASFFKPTLKAFLR